MKHILIYIVLLSAGSSIAQHNFDPDSILIGDRPLPKVLLVGSFHFAYYNLDAHVTKEEDQVNVLLPHRQKEMEALVDYIAAFKPNKIVVESGPNTGYLMHRYREWKSGKRELQASETEQIAFRLMKRFDLDTLYGCDDGTLVWDMYDGPDSLAFRPYLDSLYADWDFDSDDVISQAYDRLYEEDDKMALKNTLLQQFQQMNNEKAYNRDFGAYLAGDFCLGDTRGADALAMHWYSRNLRIFRHIQQITTSPDDRIMVLFGAGHMSVLYHLFECSVEYEVVEFGDTKQ